MGMIQSKSSGEFKQLVIDDAERLEGPLAHAIPEMTASILVPIFVILYLLVIDWRMALAALVSGNAFNFRFLLHLGHDLCVFQRRKISAGGLDLCREGGP